MQASPDENEIPSNLVKGKQPLNQLKNAKPTKVIPVDKRPVVAIEKKQDDVSAAMDAEFRELYNSAVNIEELVLTTPAHNLLGKFGGGCKLYNSQMLSGDRYYADELVHQLEADYARRLACCHGEKPQKSRQEDVRFVVVVNTNVGPYMLLRKDGLRWGFPIHVGLSEQTFGNDVWKGLVEATARAGQEGVSSYIEKQIKTADRTYELLFRITGMDSENLITVNVVPLWLGESSPPALVNVPGQPEYVWAMCTPDYKETAKMDSVDAHLLDYILPGLLNTFEGSMYLVDGDDQQSQ